ncbi:carboxypeptidase-like regulatory domain-containing protein [Natronorubrum aibiense]|uniref:Carboxypeptidase regulatory-like domain-containing protein n=1 Tax=Natronorubrum aibiense TaxID=348826 RepID=A0A5P9P337_9EURY|nr:carboxypeptidase-like regulatory domain-containing protein [Natronorubrum aibiense]QFU82551.1 carboxypeptidase regulatory-like domain-containing protein [Natronorubrum aibiense]
MSHKHTFVTVLASLALIALVSIALVPGAVAEESYSGTVTVADGSAEGDNITITPLDAGYNAVDDPTETTIENGSFSYERADNASVYFIKLEHAGAAHYELVTDGQEPTITLNETATGTLVDEDGDPVSNATINVTSEHGPPVDQLTVDDGSFTLEPLQPDRTYPIRIEANGAVYERTLSTGDGSVDATYELPEPTADRDVLHLGGGQPVNHLLRVGPTQNGSGLFVVETVSLENSADRPYAGPVEFAVPSDAEVVTGMVQEERTEVTVENGTATVDASIDAGEKADVSVFYRLEDQELEKPVGYDVEQFAISFVEYDLSQVEFSDNLVEADAPMPMVMNTNALEADERIAVSIDERGAVAGDERGDDSQGDELPVGLLSAAFVGIVVVGLLAYRRL